MTTSSSTSTRRCSAHCRYAQGPLCRYNCHGSNHGLLIGGQGRLILSDSHHRRPVNILPPSRRLIANAWARWKLDRKRDPAQLATVIGTLNLQMADPDNDLEGALGVVTGTRKKFEGLRKQAWETATTEIMRRAQEQTG